MLETTRPELVGSVGMVASTHWLASASGMSILERGGNAADAAAAAGFVLQVVEPHLNGPGGEVPILVWSDEEQAVRVINGQGPAPGGASIAKLRDLGLDIMPGTGHLPCVVPGAFGAWMLLLEEYGTMSLREVLAPAIHYASKGHPVLGRVSSALGTVKALFTEHWPTSAAIWLPGGRVPKPNSRFINPVLAETYGRIITEAEAVANSREAQLRSARDIWYKGFVAEAIDAFSGEEVLDTSGEQHSGLMTGDDLARWSPTFENTLSLDYKDYTVHKTGPWGQGPVMLQQLALLDGYDFGELDPGSADWIHLITETSKLAFADREAWYGDPEFTRVPTSALLSAEYADERRKLVTSQASLELIPGRPEGLVPKLPKPPRLGRDSQYAAGVGEPTLAPTGEMRGDTCHVDVVDSQGMMISATPSGGWFQSSPAIPSLGFSLSTRGQMFWLEEGLPNSLRPNARPRTTLTPSFAMRDGKPWLAFGTPGGDAQDQWSLQLFLNLVHGGMNLQEAIDAPAFHSTHFPSSFYPRDAHPGEVMAEGRMDPKVQSELRRRGHKLIVGDDWSEGRLSAVARDGGWYKAAANPRGSQGYAVGR